MAEALPNCCKLFNEYVSNYTLILATVPFEKLINKHELDLLVYGYIKNDTVKPHQFWAIAQRKIPPKDENIYFIHPVKDSVHKRRKQHHFENRCWLFDVTYRPTSICKLCDVV